MSRIQFDLPKDKAKELESLMETIGVSSKRELFNNALTLLEWAVKEVQNDRCIGSISEDEESYKELEMAIFSNARSHSARRRLAESLESSVDLSGRSRAAG